MRSQWYYEVCQCATVGFSVGAFTADVVHFHCKPMARCLSLTLTSVLFLACGGSGCPCCHLATQRHVWAATGDGVSPSPGLPLLLHCGAPMGLGSGPWKGWSRSGGGGGEVGGGPANDWSTLAVLRSAAGGVGGGGPSFEVGTSENLFTQEGEGELACRTRMPVSWWEWRRGGMHSTIPTLSEPGQDWCGSHFLFILAPSALTHRLCLWLETSLEKCEIAFLFMAPSRRLFQCGWNVTENVRLNSNDLFIPENEIFFSQYLPPRYRRRFIRGQCTSRTDGLLLSWPGTTSLCVHAEANEENHLKEVQS